MRTEQAARNAEEAILSARAVALATSATVTDPIITLKNKAILSGNDERRLHELALTMLKATNGPYTASHKQLNPIFLGLKFDCERQ